MNLEQVLTMQLSKDELVMMSKLLESKSLPKIMYMMLKGFAKISDENTQFALKTIPEIANAVIDRAKAEVCKKQQTIRTMESVMPSLKEYPYGMFGVLTYVLSECNFKEIYEKEPMFCRASRLLTGSPAAKMMLPKFREFIASGDQLWEDHAWGQLDVCGYGNECRDLVKWCIANRSVWDDM